MSEKKNNIWCVAGLSGAGKTTLCEGLKADGGFDCVSRDQEVTRLLGEFEIRVFGGDGRLRFGEGRSFVIGDLNRFNAVVADLFARPGYCDLPESEGIREFAKQLISASSVDLWDYYVTDGTLARILNLVIEGEVVRKSADLGNGKEGIVLLDNPALAYTNKRARMLSYLRGRGFDPGLLIVRATREQIERVAAQREIDDPSLKGLRHGQTDREVIFSTAPYQPAEGWERVVVMNGVMSGRDAIREKLLRGVGQEISGPVSFLME